jgi:hypothetical protein
VLSAPDRCSFGGMKIIAPSSEKKPAPLALLFRGWLVAVSDDLERSDLIRHATSLIWRNVQGAFCPFQVSPTSLSNCQSVFSFIPGPGAGGRP